MTAARVHPDGEVADQADPHARLTCNALGRREGAVGHPLQELVIQYFLRLRCRKKPDRGATWITQIRGPGAPFPLRHARCLQRLEAGMLI